MSFTGPRLLCIEDDPDTCDLVKFVFSLHGYEVITAASLAEGLRLALSERFDLYLINERFPKGRGHELLRKIRQFDAQTPAIIHSSDAREAVKAEALAAGAQAFVVKPSDPEGLFETVKRLVKGEGSSQSATDR